MFVVMFKICWNKISLNLYLFFKNLMISEQGSSIVIKDSIECQENIHVIYAKYTKHWQWSLIPAAVFCDVYVHVHVLQVCVQGTMEREDQQLCGFSDPEPGSQSVPGRSKVHQVLLQTLRYFCKFSEWKGFFCSILK